MTGKMHGENEKMMNGFYYVNLPAYKTTEYDRPKEIPEARKPVYVVRYREQKDDTSTFRGFGEGRKQMGHEKEPR